MKNNKTPKSIAYDLAIESMQKGANKEHEKRLDRYARSKLKNLEIVDYLFSHQPQEKKLANNLVDCGSYLVFRDYYTIGEKKLSGMCSCKKHLLCSFCAIRRGAKSVEKYMSVLHPILSEKTSLRPYLVTFTVKNGDALMERFNHLAKSLKFLHKRRHLPKVSSSVDSILGAVWSYEIKRGKNSGLWHPHVHAVWLSETPPNQEKLRKEWLSITGDSHMVDVRPIRARDDEELAKSLCEVFKYAVKFSEQPAEDTYHCYRNLSRRRLLGSFGCLYGVKEPDILTDDLDPYEDLPYRELFYSFYNGEYCLVKAKNDTEWQWEELQRI